MDLEALRSNYRPIDLQRGVVAEPPKKKRGFLLDQLSTVGGIVGGVAGAPLGLFGVGGGAVAGSALGEALENKLSGESLGKNVLKEGALGGVFGAGPLRLGKAAFGARSALKGGQGLASALREGAEQGAQFTIRGAAGKGLSQRGESLVAKQFRLNSTQQRNFAKLTGEEATSVLRRQGIRNPEDIAARIEPLQDAFDDVVTNIPALSKRELSTGLKAVYKPLLDSPDVLVSRPLGQTLKAQADELVKSVQGGSIGAAEVNALRKTFDQAVRYTPRGGPEYNAVKETADALRGVLQKAADKAGVRTAQGATFKEAGLELRKLRQLDDLIGKQQYLGTGSLPLSLPQLLGGTLGAGVGGAPGGLAGVVATQAINSNAGRRALASGTTRVGERLTEGVARRAAPLTARDTAKRLAPVGLLRALSEDQSLGSNIDTSAPTSSMSTTPITDIESEYANADMQSNSPFSPQNVEANVAAIIEQGGDFKDVKEYLSLVEALEGISAGPQQKPLTGEARKRALTAQSGLRSIDTLEQALINDPGSFKRQALPNPLGITGRLTGTTDIRAATDNAVDVIARLRTGANITDSEARRFARFLPLPGDSVESAKRKLANLRAELQSFAENPGEEGAPSLEDALGGYY